MSAVITTLMKRPENNFQLTVSRWKFDRFNVNSLGRILRLERSVLEKNAKKDFFFFGSA